MPLCPCKYRKTDEPRDWLGHAPFCGLYGVKEPIKSALPPLTVDQRRRLADWVNENIDPEDLPASPPPSKEGKI